MLPKLDSKKPLQAQADLIFELFGQIDQFLSGMGAFLKFSSSLPAAYSATTTNTDIKDLSGVFNSSGGLVIIYANLNCVSATTGNLFVSVAVDDISRGSNRHATTATTTISGAPVFVVGNFGAGKHYVSVRAYRDAGTHSVLAGSSINVIEFSGG